MLCGKRHQWSRDDEGFAGGSRARGIVYGSGDLQLVAWWTDPSQYGGRIAPEGLSRS